MIDLNLKQRNVLKIIQRYPEAADDDMLLLERYWYEIDGYNPDKSLYDNLSRMTRPETISRRRRELYNLGLITYSADVLKEREEAFVNERSKLQVVEPQFIASLQTEYKAVWFDESSKDKSENPHAAVSWMND